MRELNITNVQILAKNKLSNNFDSKILEAYKALLTVKRLCM